MASNSKYKPEELADGPIFIKEDLDHYISSKIKEYLASSNNNKVLQSSYQEDFKEQTKAHFKTIKRNLVNKLCQFLYL